MKIFLIGFMGSGKTYWGRRLAAQLDLPFFDLDEQIVADEGRTVNDIFQTDGEEYFRQKEKEILYIISESHEAAIIATGGGTACYFNNIDYMKAQGVVFWINPPMPVLINRLMKETATRPLLKDLSKEQLTDYIVKKFSGRRLFYEQANFHVTEEEITLNHFTEKLVHA